MATWTTFYLIRIEFLGFRYHGWQKQPDQKSVHGMIDKTLLFILKHDNFKTLGCGRTDAKVSADDFAFELFINEELIPEQLLHRLNKNLPNDIRAKSIKTVDAHFNIIQSAKVKEYHYHFSFGKKSHPFNAPLIQDCGKFLNINHMIEAASVFKGLHNFKRFASKPSPDTNFEREILTSSIERNYRLKENYTPEHSYVFKVSAKGFMRYQVRLMMGALIEVGRGLCTLQEFQQLLVDYEGEQIKHIAPSSGLLLHKVEYTES